MKPLTANRGLAFAVRWPNLDLKVSNIATTLEKVRGTANLRPTARYTLPTDLPSYAKIVICGKKFVLVVI